MNIEITGPSKSHLLTVVRALTAGGWIPREAPDGGRLVRNGQLMILRSGQADIRFRLFVYKVTGSSRGKPDERRIEITSTYQKGLKHLPEHPDVVLGYDTNHRIFVGVDPKRIAHGGPTGNASSFFDREGLDWNRVDEILVRPRSAKLFPGGVEFHAFVKPPRLAEYFFNYDAIHTGSYGGYGRYAGTSVARPAVVALARVVVKANAASGRTLVLEGPRPPLPKQRVSKKLVEAYEKGDVKLLRRKRLSPEQLLGIKRRCEENGHLGEEHVLNWERRALRRAGEKRLAERVRWVSQESVCEGYDILSYEISGNEKWIEVKATSGKGHVVDMSDYEWQTACRAGEKYYIYRVTSVRTKPKVQIFRNPRELEAQGRITKSPGGWQIRLP